MRSSVLSSLTLAMAFALSASAAYVDQYSDANCTGSVVQTISLNPNQQECLSQIGASLFVSTDDYPCTFKLFTDSDSPEGCNFGSVTGVLNNSANTQGCINFYGTGEFIQGTCGSE